MATNFPASLDTLTNPTSSDPLSSPSHSAQHANVNDAVEALQAKVGADSSAVTTSLDYKVAQLEAISHGKILQVVSTTKTDTFTSSATTFTAITGLSASITPTDAASKVLVVVNIKGASETSTSNATFNYRVMRGATAIGIGDTRGNRDRATGSVGTRGFGLGTTINADTAVILDSPATTSATTYSVQGKTYAAATWYVNRAELDTDTGFYFTAISSVTLMEVSA